MSAATRPPLVTTGSTVSAAENIVAWLKTAIAGSGPDQVSVVERHIGQFKTAAEVKTYLSDRDGSVRVAALRVRNITCLGGVSGTVTWCAYVMTSDQWGYSRDTRAEIIVGKIARRIIEPGAVAGMKAQKAAGSVSADNIYTGELNDLGVTLWAVTWDQDFGLEDETDISGLDDFLQHYQTWPADNENAPTWEADVRLPGPDKTGD
ncbi:hypothetical protein CI266_002177 [Salmonella enterica subsp. enterica serovar Kotte]|nr:hypothetical protein [Salmonella enterica subsp. enterica serovar Kotte]